MPDGERDELRKCWYPLIARKDADRARYAALADTPVDPFGPWHILPPPAAIPKLVVKRRPRSRWHARSGS